MRINEIITESYQIDEGLGDWIYQKIDSLLGSPKPHPKAAADAVAKAPPVLPDDIAEKLVADFLKKKEHEKLIQQAAAAKQSSVDQVVAVLRHFVKIFIDRWQREVPREVRQTFWKDLSDRAVSLIMFIVKSMLERK